MPIEFVAANALLPDTGTIGNDGLMYNQGVAPLAGVYSPVYPPPHGNALTASSANAQIDGVYGLHYLPDASFTPRSVVGFVTKLRNNSDTDLTRLAGGAYATDTLSGFGWQFTNFGTKVLATNFIDDIQTGNGTTAFAKNNVIATPTSADPKARFIASWKSHVVIAGFSLASPFGSLSATDYPNSFWISATDDETRWGSPVDTPSLINTEFAHLYDNNGVITGLSSGENLTIFKVRGIYQLSGPPYNVNQISHGQGTQFPNSICKYYDDVYFWGRIGPCVLRPDGSVEELGKGKWTKLIRNFATIPQQQPINAYVSAAASYKTGTVFFSVPTNIHSTTLGALTHVPADFQVLAIDIASGDMGVVYLTSDTGSNVTEDAPLFLRSPNYPANYPFGPPMRDLGYVSCAIATPVTSVGYRVHDAGQGSEVSNFPSPIVETKMLRPSNAKDEESFKIKRMKLIYSGDPSTVSVGLSAVAPTGYTAPTFTYKIRSSSSALPGTAFLDKTYTGAPNMVDDWVSTETDTFSKYKSLYGAISNISTVAQLAVLGIQGIMYEWEGGGVNA